MENKAVEHSDAHMSNQTESTENPFISHIKCSAQEERLNSGNALHWPDVQKKIDG